MQHCWCNTLSVLTWLSKNKEVVRENNNIAPTMLLCLSLALNYKKVTKNITDINITSLGINAVVSQTCENTHTSFLFSQS